ncbi:hypothetical protein [Streptomyces sp. CA-256286]|uniref:hypothetical protein n=1 Tax=Streptomyces sp. CA-256286 TaxID=2801033 RepID=UPI001A98F9C0|nr:hypothetical protein [Streptomyces sp. CA-256286]QTA36072.1 hypothetical protein JHY03_62860 [Streptomyces sp. CA-256286]
MSFLTDVVEAIRAHRAELETLLDPPARAELLEILADSESDPVVAAADLRELIKPFTPPGHPLRAALTPSGVRFQPGTAAPPDGDALLALLVHLRSEVEIEGSPADAPRDVHRPAPESHAGDENHPTREGHTADDSRSAPADHPAAENRSALADRAAPPYRPDADDAWLLAEPALQSASLDLAPEHARDLIRLTVADEEERVPAFQLDPASGTPYPVVVEINRLLSADEDPWGAVDWWLGPNVWLDAAPARLLGTGVDHALLSAARAEIPEW